MSVQNLKPTIDEIKRLYGDNQKRVQKETAALYEKSGVNPLAGNLYPRRQTAAAKHMPLPFIALRASYWTTSS